MEEQSFSQCCPVIRKLISFSRTACISGSRQMESSSPMFEAMSSWLRTHENAQVMFASVLVVFAIWWLVRCVLSIIINLLCPLVVVVIAVICIPQLRTPLLGQNYPALANLLRSLLLKLAETLKTT